MLKEISTALESMIEDDNKPIVVFSAIWPFVYAMQAKPEEICQGLCQSLLRFSDKHTVLMPTFVNGFVNGVCDLDKLPSTTGALPENFRNQPGVRRTISAFFPFSVKGPEAEEVIQLRPKEAWGKGSLYEWFYKKDAYIVTLGLHPSHCSYSHYAEWLMKDKIDYRYNKTFSGKVIHEGVESEHIETLLVRRLEPKVDNDFTWLLNEYKNAGMKIKVIDNISISAMSARNKIDVMVNAVKNDPSALIKFSELL